MDFGPGWTCAATALALAATGVLAACGDEGREVRAYYESGALESEARELPGPDGTWRRNGRFDAWYEGGQVEAEGNYVDGVASGPWKHWHSDGTPRARGSYLFGEKEGVWVHRTPEGAIDEELTGVYEADAKVAEFLVDGTQLDWFDKERPREETHYVDGRRHGRSVTWYPNGKKRSQGNFHEGRKTGAWTYWNEDGSVDRRRTGLYEGRHRVED